MSSDKFIIAVQPDSYGPEDASSPIWTRLLRAEGHEVREVDVHRADILEQLRGCDGFMWRHGHLPNMRQIAKRLLPVIEHLGLAVYPDQNTCWHYDDKIAQSYLLEATDIPTPHTWVWYDSNLAKEWASTASYPFVVKLWSGAGSANVLMVNSYDEALSLIDKLFGRGVHSLEGDSPCPLPLRSRAKASVKLLLEGVSLPPPVPSEYSWELHKNYLLCQEFLPGNAFDTRVTVIGNRAFGFRRYNRANDFRASGSGQIDFNPAGVAPEFIRLAFEVARKLGMQSCAIDGLWRGEESVVVEISYTYASWAVHECPGHWDAELNWHDGNMRPEEAQITDLINKLKKIG